LGRRTGLVHRAAWELRIRQGSRSEKLRAGSWKLFFWCERGDLNPHALSGTGS
jgi:hypothetical protein